MIQTRKKLPPAEKLRKSWRQWRDDGKEPSIKEVKAIFSNALPKYNVREDFQENILLKIKQNDSGKLDERTSFLMWDMIENGSQFTQYVFEYVQSHHALYEQAGAIFEEQYDDPLLILGSFVARLYAEATGYVVGTGR